MVADFFYSECVKLCVEILSFLWDLWGRVLWLTGWGEGGCPVPQTSHPWLSDPLMVLPTLFWSKDRASIIQCNSQWFFNSVSDSCVTVTTQVMLWYVRFQGELLQPTLVFQVPSWWVSQIVPEISFHAVGAGEWGGEDIYLPMICTGY